MNTLAELEAAVPKLSAEELAALERFVRSARLSMARGGGRSALELPPLDLGRMLKPLGSRVESMTPELVPVPPSPTERILRDLRAAFAG